MSPDSSQRSTRRTLGFLALFLLWLMILAALVVWTANPVTFSRLQLRQANTIVVATPIGRSESEDGVTFQLDEILAGPSPVDDDDTFTVTEWQLPADSETQPLILPLRRDGKGGWTIAPAPKPKAPDVPPAELDRLVYPGSDRTIARIKEILAER